MKIAMIATMAIPVSFAAVIMLAKVKVGNNACVSLWKVILLVKVRLGLSTVNSHQKESSSKVRQSISIINSTTECHHAYTYWL